MRPGRGVTLLLLLGGAVLVGGVVGRVGREEPAARRVADGFAEVSEEVGPEPPVRPLVRRKAPGQAAHHTAVVTARLVAGGASQVDAEGEALRLLEPTGCGERTRFFVVPRGFTDGGAIQDRISIESSYYEAEVTEVADSSIPAETGFAPQFSRIISVVFLFDCPPARA